MNSAPWAKFSTPNVPSTIVRPEATSASKEPSARPLKAWLSSVLMLGTGASGMEAARERPQIYGPSLQPSASTGLMQSSPDTRSMMS
jgi:hypothetical protein